MKRLQPEKFDSPTYRQIWRVVDGAVATALTSHPEYLANGARVRSVRNSIVKRVVGAIYGYAEQSAWVRSGFSPADESGSASHKVGAEGPCELAAPQFAAGNGEQAGEATNLSRPLCEEGA